MYFVYFVDLGQQCLVLAHGPRSGPVANTVGSYLSSCERSEHVAVGPEISLTPQNDVFC